MDPSGLTNAMTGSFDVQSEQISANAAQAGLNSGMTGASAATAMVGSTAELKAKYPKVYKEIVQGIAMNICNQMHQDETQWEAIADNNQY